jgi:tellurium resistance protein TerD
MIANMNHQYFIRRNNKLRGPFSAEQIQALVDSNKLRTSDYISVDSTDNWQSVGEFFPSKANEPLPEVEDVKLTSDVFGRKLATYDCPGCKDKLRSKENMIGEVEFCPSCNIEFRIADSALELFKAERLREREEKAKRQKDILERKKRDADRKEEVRKRQQRQQRRTKTVAEANDDLAKSRSVGSQENDTIACKKCGSTQLTANKKGFGLGKAAAGGLLLGPVGLLGGMLGGSKVRITCLKCGHDWIAGGS